MTGDEEVRGAEAVGAAGGWRRWAAPLTRVLARPEPLLIPLSVLGAVLLAASFIPFHGWDFNAYWTVDPLHPYAGQTGQLSALGAFFYAPPIAWLMAPLGSLPLPAAQVLWLALQVAALYVIAGRWALVLVIFPPVWLDITYGNINILLAAAVAVGLRHPAAWAWVLLTKMTPGVGLVWFLVRREWRALAIVAVVTALICLPTLLVPRLWAEWFTLLWDSRSSPAPPDALPVPLAIRVIAAAILIAWGARTDRRWTVGVGATVAMPVLWPIAFAVLISALPRPVAKGPGRAGEAPSGPGAERPAGRGTGPSVV